MVATLANPTITEDSLKALATRIRGTIIEPGTAGYDEARAVYNAMHDRYPALIVQPVDTADVAAVDRKSVV